MQITNYFPHQIQGKMFSNILFRSFCNKPNVYRIKSIFNKKPINESIEVNGWIKAVRKMKMATFLDIDDGSTSKKLQVLVDSEKSVQGFSYHCGVSIIGKLKRSTHPKQEFELHAEHIKIHPKVEANTTYPFAARRKFPPEYVREFQELRPRTNLFSATMRIRSQMKHSLSQVMRASDYIEVDTPIITASREEGGSEVFHLKTDEELTKKDSVPFFGKNVYLSVSAQMYLEAFANGLTAVYTLSPAFRAEPSTGRSHLAEFYMMEAEEAFLEGEEGMETIMGKVELLVKDILRDTMEKCADDINLHWKEHLPQEGLVRHAVTNPFASVTYAEAVELLSPHLPISHGEDFTKRHEAMLTTLCGGPVFVTHFPYELKPFYMPESTKYPGTALCFDLLFPSVGEVVGGSLRQTDPTILQSRMSVEEGNQWYIQLRNKGSVSTAGYGLGFERLLLLLTGVQHIKDVIPFPRAVRYCTT